MACTYMSNLSCINGSRTMVRELMFKGQLFPTRIQRPGNATIFGMCSGVLMYSRVLILESHAVRGAKDR